MFDQPYVFDTTRWRVVVRRIGRSDLALVAGFRWSTWAAGFQIMRGGAVVFLGPAFVGVASFRVMLHDDRGES